MNHLFSFIAFLLGAVISFSLLNYFISTKIKGRFTVDEIPLGVNMLKAIYFICGGIMLAEIRDPLTDLNDILSNSANKENWLLNEAMYFSIFLGISILSTFIVLWFSSITYSVATKGTNAMSDAINNKTSNLVLYAGIAFSFTIIVKGSMSPILTWIIPYPTTPLFH
ncbi:MAG: hypothetical protein IPM36_17165 [Lewinellaceae bacterium]|nr:hypothetical protein [Lewinellaceae bacterium]